VRPWYKKKRFMIPIGLVAIPIAIGSVIPDDKPAAAGISASGIAAPASTTEAVEPVVETSSAAEIQAAQDAADAKAQKRAQTKARARARAKVRAEAKAAQKRRAVAAARRKAAAKPKPAPVQRPTVTPGAFCADAQAGDVGVSSAGNSYRCSLYSSGRYRWRRI
jgi:hypothetical protein